MSFTLHDLAQLDLAHPDLVVADLNQIVAINNAEIPAVTKLDTESAAELVGMCSVALSCVEGGEVLAFCLVLGPGQAYRSANYRWVSQRYDRFVYLDRVCVKPQAQRRGIGRALYAEVLARSAGLDPRPEVLALEVNSRPYNTESMAFHTALGFDAIGTANPYGDDTEVTYFAHEV